MATSSNNKQAKSDRDLLMAAINKNQVTFSQVAKTAEALSNGNLKIKLDSSSKMVLIQYLDKKVAIELNTLRLNGFKYLNNILIDDILTKVELDEIYKTLEAVQQELLNKADKEHTHEITDIVGVDGIVTKDDVQPFIINSMPEFLKVDMMTDTHIAFRLVNDDQYRWKKVVISLKNGGSTMGTYSCYTYVYAKGKVTTEWLYEQTVFSYGDLSTFGLVYRYNPKHSLYVDFEDVGSGPISITKVDFCSTIPSNSLLTYEAANNMLVNKDYVPLGLNVEGLTSSDDVIIRNKRSNVAGVFTVRYGGDKFRYVYDIRLKKFVFMFLDDTEYLGKPVEIAFNSTENIVYKNNVYGTTEGTMPVQYLDAALYGNPKYFAVSIIEGLYGLTIYINGESEAYLEGPYGSDAIRNEDAISYACLKENLDLLPNFADMHSITTRIRDHTHTNIDNDLTVNGLVTANAVGTSALQVYDTIGASNISIQKESKSFMLKTDAIIQTDASKSTAIKAGKIELNGDPFSAYTSYNSISNITAQHSKYNIKLSAQGYDRTSAELEFELRSISDNVTFNIYVWNVDKSKHIGYVNGIYSSSSTINGTIDNANNDCLSEIPFVSNGHLILRFNFEEATTIYNLQVLFRYYPPGQTQVDDTVTITFNFKTITEGNVNVNNEVLTRRYLVDWLYPVGSIYMSMNNVNPSVLFGGTWTQIVDRFLLCSSSNSKATGGSTKITTNNLPAHNHTFYGNTSSAGSHNHTTNLIQGSSDFGFQIGSKAYSDRIIVGKNQSEKADKYTTTSTVAAHTHSFNGTTSSVGYGNDYYQPFMRCYCWYRTA